MFAFPSTLSLDSIGIQDQSVIVRLHAAAPIAACPQCGTAGSRVHSRDLRTIADVAFGGRSLVLKLLVRKWICPLASCSQRIKALRFPELVQRYARMTNRLIEALQAVGVRTNGADAAHILSSLGMPTTAKTVIRRVLQLALPTEGTVHVAGVDEWAWKKGAHYGTILVDLEQRRIAARLAERSLETSIAWFKHHPEIDIVSRDRGKLFREAAFAGAPQAKHVVDRFHLQQNFAEALEKFFRPKTRVLKMAARNSAGTPHPAPRAKVPHQAQQERHRRHRQRVAVHKQVWKLFREGYHKEQIARLVGISSRSVYRVLEQQEAPSPRRRSRCHSLIDPYLAYLTERWNQGCHSGGRLYEEIRTQGYAGSKRTTDQAASNVSSSWLEYGHETGQHPGESPFRPRHRADDRSACTQPHGGANRLSCAAHAKRLHRCQSFHAGAGRMPQLLCQHEGKPRLEQWKAAVLASGIKELMDFVDGLADDAEAVTNGCSESWSNGMVGGFVSQP